MSIHVIASTTLFAVLVLCGMGFTSALGQQSGATTLPTLTPNNTINAQPACRVSRRELCRLDVGASCGRGGVRAICSSGEKRVQVGTVVYCDKWVCN